MSDKMPADPFPMFGEWFEEAHETEINDPNAVTVASVDAEGRPSARMVLLKGWDPQGFVFYTNFESRKGQQILGNPNVALLFHWKSLQRQIRIEGTAAQVPDEEADAYYASRARQSRIGAWASKQSRPLESRFALEKAVASYAAKFNIGEIPRPPHWSGFRVTPRKIEFWRDGAFRLHDRFVYDRQDDDSWTITRLYP